ncbi:efflux ABC transporter, permease protein [Synechococcus sp. PCC 7335]|uniref:cell division protein FtsX n=1 Tax=Synechococcus sp. (strain ATCC 29403 / PCC 7335) TaxID=91464 RepID=UPI00017EB09B|nr:ABC transporter permease [Synechococcus sp. PCC 7335]EDX85199.1 efflux ABC transporter, permease protein [Synechococcus sp. PCC 7335]
MLLRPKSVLKSLARTDYLFQETFRGLQRGGWMNWAAISTMTVLLFLFGTSLQVSWQVEGMLNQFGSQLVISTYLESGVGADTLTEQVSQLPGVVSVEAVSREQAWSQLTSDLGLSNISNAIDQLNGNPLVDELKVKARDTQQVPQLAATLKNLPGVDEVLYVSEMIQQLRDLNIGLQWASLVVVSLLSIAATTVVTTTIRLIAIARRQEIEVMQLVGATRIWIYLPFLIQGAVFGIIGAGGAWGLLLAAQQGLRSVSTGNGQPSFIEFLANGLQLSSHQWMVLPCSLVLLGTGLGVLGSLLAVEKAVAAR